MDLDFPVLAMVDEGLSVLRLQVFKPVVGLHVFLLFDHVCEGLLHLDPFMLVQNQLLLLLLLVRDKELLFVDLSVKCQPGPFVDLDGSVVRLLIPVEAKGWEGVGQSE